MTRSWPDCSEGKWPHAFALALPRLGRGEGWVWAPSDGVLARVAFPLIRTFDSSGAPRRDERARVSGPRPPVDLATLAATLAGAEAEDADPVGVGRRQAWDLERRLRQREQELAAALARVAGLEAALWARLQQIDERQDRTA